MEARARYQCLAGCLGALAPRERPPSSDHADSGIRSCLWGCMGGALGCLGAKGAWIRTAREVSRFCQGMP